LKVIDFCDANEIEDQKELWESQIEELQKVIGG
jgi:hypothetical protein